MSLREPPPLPRTHVGRGVRRDQPDADAGGVGLPEDLRRYDLRMKTTAGLLSLALLLTGCQKTEAPAGEMPKAAADAKEAVAQAPVVPADPSDPKALLTDEMLAKYVVYQTTLLPVMGDTLAMGGRALQGSGGDQKEFEKQVAADPRFQRVDAATKEASAKSGLTAQTAAAIGGLVSGYVAERSMGTAEEKAKVRADFEQKYGTPAAEAMDRHEAELTKLQEETLKAALGPAKK